MNTHDGRPGVNRCLSPPDGATAVDFDRDLAVFARLEDRTASRKPGTNRRLEASARDRKPAVPRADNELPGWFRNSCRCLRFL